MARIRTFKPEFLRHEELQELETNHPGKYPMFVYLGLWSVCDRQGVFQWKPRSLKLDIYPFLPFDMAETLEILIDAGFITRFTNDDALYGYIPDLRDYTDDPDRYTHWNWKGGITPENHRIRESTEYKHWIKKVFFRDNYTCQKCGKKGGVLNAHHIKPFAMFPELRTVVSNGLTLCKKCHKELHKKNRGTK